MISGWSPGIGDPTLIGWITTIAYLFAAMLCFGAGTARPADMRAARSDRIWLSFGVLLITLGINKELDLQSLLTAVGRDAAHREGWYDGRRAVQEIFIVAMMIGGVTLMAVAAIVLARYGWWLRLAGSGLAFLVTFIVIRAASFHHMDALLKTNVVGMRTNAVLELGGIAAIALGAFGSLAARRRTRRV